MRVLPKNLPIYLIFRRIALEHKADILTRNLKHFKRVQGLKIETW